MKKRLFTFAVAILLCSSLSGQDFISSEKKWNVRITGLDIGGIVFHTEIFQIHGDTVVNSLTYDIIWASFDSLSTWQYQGLLREDSNIVYYIPPGGYEGVLYDFNLKGGDTAYVTNFFCNDIPIYVIDVDTVEHLGVSRKRWLLGEDGYVQESWIEGIGSLYGPLHTRFMYCIVCPAWDLLCYSNNDQLEYMMSGQTDCYQSTVGIAEQIDDSGFVIYPNPIRRGNSMYIKTNSVPSNISIYNASGLLVKTLRTVNDTTTRLETANLASGLYLITVTTSDSKINTQKILIR